MVCAALVWQHLYLLLLSLVRGILLVPQRKAKRAGGELAERYRREIFIRTSGIVLMMNAALL